MKALFEKKWFTLILVVLILLICTSVVCTAASLTFFGLTSGCDYTANLNNNSEAFATSAMQNINTISSYYCTVDLSKNANVTYNKLSGKAFYLFVGHGNAGKISFSNGVDLSYITGSNNTSPSYAISALSSLSSMKIAAYISCYSANTNSTNGNLLSATYNKGASSAIGFTSTIAFGNTTMKVFSDKFTSKLADQKTVSSAASSAKNAVLLNSLSYNGYNNYSITGSTTTKLF